MDDNRYKVDLHVRLTGLAAIVSNLRMALASSGAFQGGAISPADLRHRRLQFQGDPHPAHGDQPWRGAAGGKFPVLGRSKSPERVPLTDAHKRDIIDPLSAFLMPVPEGASPVGPSVCNRRVPVFDGYTRFDVTLTYVGAKEVKTRAIPAR